MEIVMDELGRFWCVNGDGNPYAGPYNTPEEAHADHPEAIWQAGLGNDEAV